MNILQTLRQLRDDIKLWTTNNLNALNAKIDEKTIPIDSELSSTSTNPVQNKAIKKAIDNIPTFSGDYNDLTNAPDISEDGSGNMVIADESGNIIFKVDADGIHTTAVSINGEAAASEKYVDDAIANIDIPEVDFTGYATEGYVTDTVNAAKEELSESIVSETEEFHIIDEASNIVASIDENGVATTTVTAQCIIVNGDNVEEHMDNTSIHVTATEKEAWNNKSNFSGSYNDLTDKPEATDLSNYYTKAEVDDAIENVDVDLSGYATEDYVNTAIDNIEFPTTDLTDYATKKYVDDSIDGIEIPEVDFTGYATEDYVDNKVADLVNSTPEALEALGELAIALENHEDTYDALLETVGGKATKAELENMKTELSESIESESEKLHIVDNSGNIVATIDASGISTTTVAAQNITINGLDIEDLIQARVQAYIDQAILGGEW